MNEFFQQNKKNLLLVLGVVVLVGGAFATGRYTAPESVREVERVVVQEVEVEKVVIKEVEKKIYVQQQNNNVRTETVVVAHPDGTTETRTVTEDRTTTSTASTQESERSEERERVVYVDKVVEKEKVVESAKPQWALGAQVEGGVLFLKPIQPIVGIGVTAERRIIGPFFMGLSVRTTLGVNATGFTGPYGVQGGLTVRAEF